MSPDEDSQLRSAFTELHQRNQAQAPSFEAMRERATRAANAGGGAEASSTHARSFPILRLACWAPAVCAVVASIWVVSSEGRRRGSKPEAAASSAAVDQIFMRIEAHVDYHAAIALPEYPSDVLLTSPNADTSP